MFIKGQDGIVQAKSNGSKVFNYITLLKLEQNKISQVADDGGQWPTATLDQGQRGWSEGRG